MAVRNFDGTDDALVLLPGAMAAAPGGPYTFAVLVKRLENADNGMVSIGNGFSTSSASFSQGKATFWPGNTTSTGVHVATGSTDGPSTLLWTQADVWTLLVTTKASGSVAPRYHRYVLGTATITRANSSASIANSAMAGTDRIVFGKDEYTNRLVARFAAAAYWDVALTDGQVDEITAALSTNSMYVNSAGAPLVLWEFNQAAVGDGVTDLTGGGADQTAIVGTNVIADGVDDPPGWTFGLGDPPQVILPDADVVTTGWTTAPLHSKLADSSDATVITGTLA